MNEKLRDLYARYNALGHAVQTGVATETELNMERAGRDAPTEPKHLRVGINLRAVDHSALVTLLIAKGVFTEEEYGAALVEAAEKEVRRYEVHLAERFGVRVTLA